MSAVSGRLPCWQGWQVCAPDLPGWALACAEAELAGSGRGHAQGGGCPGALGASSLRKSHCPIAALRSSRHDRQNELEIGTRTGSPLATSTSTSGQPGSKYRSRSLADSPMP